MALCHSQVPWCYVQILALQKPHIPASFNMYLVITKWVITVKVSNFSGQYLRKHWTLGIDVLGYIGIVWPKEHSPAVWPVPPVTPYFFSFLIPRLDVMKRPWEKFTNSWFSFLHSKRWSAQKLVVLIRKPEVHNGQNQTETDNEHGSMKLVTDFSVLENIK